MSAAYLEKLNDRQREAVGRVRHVARYSVHRDLSSIGICP